MSDKLRYPCPFCKEDKPRHSTYLRRHIRRYHNQMTEIEMERYIIGYRYPHLDIEAVVQRYVDKLETLITLLEKGYYFKRYLEVLGVLRPYRHDLTIGAIIKKNPGMQTAEDVRAAFESQLIGKFRDSSPEVRFKGYLNRDIAILEKNGHGDLVEAVTTLKTIKFVKKRLQEVQEETKKPDDSEPEPV